MASMQFIPDCPRLTSRKRSRGNLTSLTFYPVNPVLPDFAARAEWRTPAKKVLAMWFGVMLNYNTIEVELES
jgi:hypothetical protein